MSATGDRPLPPSALADLDPQAGATLLEMLVVVGLMAMLATLGLASFRPALRRASLSAQASGLVLSLAHTRAAALRTDQETTFAVSPDGGSYRAAGRTIALAPGVRLGGDPAAMTFTPEGASSGGRLRLEAGRRRLEFAITAAGLVSRGPG